MLKVVLEQMEHVMMAFNVFIALGLLVAPVATLLPELTPTQDASVLLAALLPVAVGLLGYFFVGYYFVVIKVPLTLLMSIDFSTSMLPEVLRSDSVRRVNVIYVVRIRYVTSECCRSCLDSF